MCACRGGDPGDVYGRLEEGGYGHKTVCHARGEYARDEDGDGFCEVHVNTMEGVWSPLRSWLRPHRGISQEKLPIYLGFFESASLSSCTTRAGAEKPCSAPLSLPWSDDVLRHPGSRQELFGIAGIERDRAADPLRRDVETETRPRRVVERSHDAIARPEAVFHV